MQYAMLYGDKSMPSKTGQRARCPICEGEVLSKCGEINIHHWAHLSGVDCDAWSEPETQWHRDWKNIFPPEWREITIENHRADIRIPEGPVIEFQHSTLSPEEIREREDFYTKCVGGLIWMVDGSEFMKEWVKFNWNDWAYQDWHTPLGYSPFDEVFYKGVGGLRVDKYFPEEVKVDVELLKPVRWPHARKSWAFAQQPLFFDSGKRDQAPENNLFSQGIKKERVSIKPTSLGNALTKAGFNHSGFEEWFSISYHQYPDSDIFEWLGTVNDSGKKSTLNSRKSLNLPKYLVGRFRPFDDAVSELKNLGNINESNA